MTVKGKGKKGLAQQRAKGEVEDEEEDADFQEEADDDVADAASEEEDEEEEEEKPKKKRAAPKAKADKPAKVAKKTEKPAAKADKPAKKAKAADKPAKKEKAKKDPNAPKRGLSAFMYFSNAERPKLKEEQPDLPFGEVGKELGVRWKSISDKDKKQYEDKAAEDKIRYTKEKAAYDKKGGAAATADDDEDDE